MYFLNNYVLAGRTTYACQTLRNLPSDRPLTERMKIAAKLSDRIHKKLEQEEASNLGMQAEQRGTALCNWLRKDIQQSTATDIELKKEILASMSQIKVLNLRPFLPWMICENACTYLLACIRTLSVLT